MIDIIKTLAAMMFASAMISSPVIATAQTGHDHHGHGSHQGHEELAAKPGLPDGSILNLGSEWKDQDGAKVNLSSLSGRARVVTMLYTTCTSACPMLIQDMKTVQGALTPEERNRVSFSAFSFDPKRDTPDKLKAFAAKMSLEAKSWSLFAAPEATVNELATVLGVRYKKLDNGDYIHSNVIFLLNDKGEVVARKDGLKTPTADFVKAVKSAVVKK